MDDVSKKFPSITAGLQKASERLKAVWPHPDLQPELEKLREQVRAELQSVRNLGIDGVPGFDDDAPGDLIDLCNALKIDPHCRFDELLSEVRAWALRRRLEVQVDVKLLGLKHRSPSDDAPPKSPPKKASTPVKGWFKTEPPPTEGWYQSPITDTLKNLALIVECDKRTLKENCIRGTAWVRKLSARKFEMYARNKREYANFTANSNNLMAEAACETA